MYKIIFNLLLSILISVACFSQQKTKPIEFLNAKSNWTRVPFKDPFPNIGVFPRLIKYPIVEDSFLYFVGDLCYADCHGYYVEKVNANDGTLIWQDYYYNEKKNERIAPVNAKLKDDKTLEIMLLKENDKTGKQFPSWFLSNINAITYCSTGKKCDSLVTSQNDSLNVQTKMLYDWKGINVGSFTKKNNDTTLYIEYGSYNKKLNFFIYHLDKNGHNIDSSSITIPLLVRNVQVIEYETDKYLAMMTTHNDSLSECYLAYFDKNFKLVKWIDITKHFKLNTGYTSIQYYGKNRIVLSRFLPNVLVNDEEKQLFNIILINYEGILLEKTEYIATNSFEYCQSIPIGNSNKILTFSDNYDNNSIDVWSVDNDGKNKKIKSLKLSRNAFLLEAYNLSNNKIMLSIVYRDTVALNKYRFVKQFSLLDLNELDFSTAINETMLAAFSFYPNPANTQLTIKTELHYDAIRVYSIEGKLIQQLERQDNTLDVSVLVSGMYFFELLEKNRAVTRKEKFVKME